jgi:hypothetical protein
VVHMLDGTHYENMLGTEFYITPTPWEFTH